MKLSELQSALRELNHAPTKSLGQNFLHDKNLADWIISCLELAPGDRWLEIGPGLGALTNVALERSQNGTLIEKDDRLIGFLEERYPGLRVVHQDACEFDTRTLLPGGPLKIFGNLPYYVSSQILFNFTAVTCPATLMLFTLQKELAERIAADPGGKDFGGPTLLIGRRWKVRLLRTLPGSVFLPVPKVDSAVVLMTPRPPDELPACEGGRFEKLVKLGFSQRRKQLGKLLGDEVPDWPDAAAVLGVPATARAESLSLAQWCRLASWNGQSAASDPATGAQDVHGEIFDVVDEEDRVVAQNTRFEVHRQKLRHRAVHVFVFNKRGELFLQKRSRWKDICPLVWDSSAAGHVNSGETYDETAPRELQEELGVSAPVHLVTRIAACKETGDEFVGLYRAMHEGPFHLPPPEIECGAWFTREQLERWIAARPGDFAPGFLVCWKAWLKSLQPPSA